jgi:hypothetical protein
MSVQTILCVIDKTCCICLDTINQQNSAEIAETVCHHFFHDGCLVEWIKSNDTCPLCRRQIVQGAIHPVPAAGLVEGDRIEDGDPAPIGAHDDFVWIFPYRSSWHDNW